MERHRNRQGPLEIEIHPDDAAARGVSDGAMVRVTNELGSVIAVCSVRESVRPGVASMLFGSSRDADSCAGGVNVLTPEAPTDWGGGSGFYSAMVEVEPV
jgi:anaerobic selenocysteine-containing dehydrogenase